MDKVCSALLNLLSLSLINDLSFPIKLSDDEWKLLFCEAQAHQVQHIIIEEAYKQGKSVNPILFENWKKHTLASVFGFNKRLSIITSLLDSFREANIPVLALKGLYFKMLYPKPEFRTMGDIDILVKREYLEKSIKLIESYGYVKARKEDPKHYTFLHDQYIMIELHVALVTEGKRKLASSLTNEIWQSSTVFRYNDMSFLIPSDFNHLLYCCLHMTNHFGHGGFGLRQLTDFYLLARKQENIIDWDAWINQAAVYGIKKFAIAILTLCKKIYQLKVPEHILSYDNIEDKAYIDQFLDAIIDSGVFGAKSKKALSDRTLASYMVRKDGKAKVSRLGYIFPSKMELNQRYSYAKKNAVLLPVAWIHRLLNNLFRSDLKLREKIPDSYRVNEYVKLFRWLDIRY